VALFQAVFSNFPFLINDIVVPVVELIGRLNLSIKNQKAFNISKLKLSEKFVNLAKPIFIHNIKEFNLFKIKEEAKEEELFEAFQNHLSSLSKPVRDAILFKLSSNLIKELAQTHGEELSSSDADTLTQVVFAKLKTNWSEL
jgi:precorrin-6B methylase 2